MWRIPLNLLKRGIKPATCAKPSFRLIPPPGLMGPPSYCSSSVNRGAGNCESNNGNGNGNEMTYAEAKRLMRLVNVEALKEKLGVEEKEVIGYSELLQACKSIGVAKSAVEAAAFARVLDEAGVVFLFRDKVYLHPDKVVDLVRGAVPLVLLPEDDPSKDEQF
ncbi:unnamed protein product [Fraxinus pennsylvanica]|uniref:Calcium uniporter protein n=1 Tax=Fraxinus pennsylvanica TaxID=56036 RepID=A0AAD1ZVQ4_9LAMI|nr:unnamed protein product [Fraxinus pennsylvanica]